MHCIRKKGKRNKIISDLYLRFILMTNIYLVCFLRLSMTGAPIVRFGTKCLHKQKNIKQNNDDLPFTPRKSKQIGSDSICASASI